MPVGVFTDAEAAVRGWARAHAGITPKAPGGIYFSVPKGASFPLATLQRVAGAPDLGEAPVDQARIQFDAWGTTKQDAAALAEAIVNAASGLQDGTVMGSEPAVAKGATVELGPVWLPDQESRRPRYVVDVTFLIVGTAA